MDPFLPLKMVLKSLRDRHSQSTPFVRTVFDTVLRVMPDALQRAGCVSMDDYILKAERSGVVRVFNADSLPMIMLA